ncbi:MAG: helix-turn-helix transcriptional regulator [Asticcacaulis sp.]|uniref:helix-turn-helix domain-containing protein n=1 Tax=Asticcacaulis sp. TaxID=1872648 RepID=UPI0039E2DA76
MAVYRKPHPVDMIVGHNIRERRRSRKLSQEALASAVGLTFQQIQKYERGSNRVSASMLCDISRVLKCRAADLLPDNDEVSQAPEWLVAARALQSRHPSLFEHLLNWPEDRLQMLLLMSRTLPASPICSVNNSRHAL